MVKANPNIKLHGGVPQIRTQSGNDGTCLAAPRSDHQGGIAHAATGRDLLDSLGVLHASLKELLSLARQKLAAIRKADVEELNRCTAAEADTLEQVFKGEQERRAIVAAAAQGLRVEHPDEISLSELASKIAEPISSAIRARMQGLQEVALDLARENKLVALVAHDLHSHIRGVFTELANARRVPVGYGREGRVESVTTETWLDAVG